MRKKKEERQRSIKGKLTIKMIGKINVKRGTN